MEEDLKKLFITIPDVYGGYSAVIQVSGFETEEEANDYLLKHHKVVKKQEKVMNSAEQAMMNALDREEFDYDI